MRRIMKAAGGVAAAGIVAAVPFLGPAWAGASGPAAPTAVGEGPHGSGGQLVFVQTDDPAGNQVVVYRRAPNGTLTWSGTYTTGGLGGVLQGSQVDHLASQGSLVYDAAEGLVFAVNAGSNTFSVFSVNGDRLTLRQVVPSGGDFPVSIAVDRDAVYVLDAVAGGTVAGFRLGAGGLRPIPGSTRALGLATMTGTTTQFTHTPGQIAFTPDGSRLVVTTKAGGQSIDVFAVGFDGTISGAPVVSTQQGQVPFAVTFGVGGSLLVANAGPDSVSSFAFGRGGTLVRLSSATTGQAATCWIAPAGGYFYASNAGSHSVSELREGPAGQLRVAGATTTNDGTVDAAASSNGQFLYVQTGATGIVDEFRVGPGGALAPIGSVLVPDAAGGEGIAAT